MAEFKYYFETTLTLQEYREKEPSLKRPLTQDSMQFHGSSRRQGLDIEGLEVFGVNVQNIRAKGPYRPVGD